MRLFLALLVLFSHSFILGGFTRGGDPLTLLSHGQTDLGQVAVGGFFVISGYLITGSFVSSRSVGAYFWRRFLRIFPAFWVCLLVTATLFAPLAWFYEHGELGGVFLVTRDSPFQYIASNWLLAIGQWNIGGLFSTTPYALTPYSLAIDGSLWTLRDEFLCYVGVVLLGLVGFRLRRRNLLIAVAALLWLAHVAYTVAPAPSAWPLERYIRRFLDPELTQLSFDFMLGAILYVYGDRIRYSGGMALAAALVLATTIVAQGFAEFGELAAAYLWMWLAIRLPLTRVDARGDFSYGVYIYAFPVQQALALVGAQRLGLVPYIGLAVIGTFPLAIASWRLVERPALALKSLSFARAWRGLRRDLPGELGVAAGGEGLRWRDRRA